ncbi:MAG: large-conductance mechanosensitive channel protein MscL, partial [Deltaproteobacteria bacterium]|nr:large-conductance mechanosensitive channel protein MscL [Deltaproteobacteria bacterium]
GNMVDMAVGIIIGAAFGKIISSLVGDVIMPPIGMALGGVDFSNLVIVMQAATEQAPAVVLSYGKFIQSIVDFLIIALCIFLVVKGINNLKKKEEAAPAAPPNQEVLLAEIRDLLKTRK